MKIGTRPLVARRQFVCACCTGAVVGWVPTLARAADQVVPVSQEPRHHKRFENEHLHVLEVILEPGDASIFHEHARDMGLVNISGAVLENEVPGESQAEIRNPKAGNIYAAIYQGKPYVHRQANIGTETFVIVAFELLAATPSGRMLSDRSGVPAYVSAVDNDRVRAWRLKLDPGQSVPPIVQSAPGLRVILSGDQVIETIEGAPDREIRIKPGSFEWQAAGRTRALRNIGTSPVELAEWELK